LANGNEVAAAPGQQDDQAAGFSLHHSKRTRSPPSWAMMRPIRATGFVQCSALDPAGLVGAADQHEADAHVEGAAHLGRRYCRLCCSQAKIGGGVQLLDSRLRARPSGTTRMMFSVRPPPVMWAMP
jgi:hypothetical protein